jgi:hypothetical protein
MTEPPHQKQTHDPTRFPFSSPVLSAFLPHPSLDYPPCLFHVQHFILSGWGNGLKPKGPGMVIEWRVATKPPSRGHTGDQLERR